jgi:hypothetical protein
MMDSPSIKLDISQFNSSPSLTNSSLLTGVATLGSTVNPNITVQTQITEQKMINPLDLSDVIDAKDKARLERIDQLLCSLSNDMPLLTKHKPRITATTYILKYDWDDSVFEFDLFKMIGRFQVSFIDEIKVSKQGLKFIIFKQSEIKKQEDVADEAPTRKRQRTDGEDHF